MCICSLRYPARNANAPFCQLWFASLYNILPHYLINGTIFERKEKITVSKCMLQFSLQLLSETFLILRINERDMIKMHIGLHVKYPSFFSDCRETFIFTTDFRKIIKYQIS